MQTSTVRLEPHRLRAIAEVLADLLIVLLCAAVLAQLSESWKVAGGGCERTPLAVGDSLKVDGVSWTAHRANLVIAVSGKCPFCSENFPFYRELASELHGKPVQIVALFPLLEPNPRAVLESSGLGSIPLRPARLGRLGFEATPTVLLVSPEGKVLAEWVGRLSPAQQSEVKAELAAHAG